MGGHESAAWLHGDIQGKPGLKCSCRKKTEQRRGGGGESGGAGGECGVGVFIHFYDHIDKVSGVPSLLGNAATLTWD